MMMEDQERVVLSENEVALITDVTNEPAKREPLLEQDKINWSAIDATYVTGSGLVGAKTAQVCAYAGTGGLILAVGLLKPKRRRRADEQES